MRLLWNAEALDSLLPPSWTTQTELILQVRTLTLARRPGLTRRLNVSLWRLVHHWDHTYPSCHWIRKEAIVGSSGQWPCIWRSGSGGCGELTDGELLHLSDRWIVDCENDKKYLFTTSLFFIN